MPHVLWVDDEVRTGDALLRVLAGTGVTAEVAHSGLEGFQQAVAGTFDAILIDLKLPDMFGLTLLQRLTAAHVSAPIIIVGGCYLQPETEAEAARLGAAATLHKPLPDVDEVRVLLRAVCVPAASARVRTPGPPPFGLVGDSPDARALIKWIPLVASGHPTVLLVGETGTGKELVARAIHEASSRRNGPFVPLNCSAIPEGLFESELFGHRRGAFTGATDDRPGLIAAAHGGTLFLDEVGELPLPMQPRLLRWLEDGRIRRVGDTAEKASNVRVIAATNRNLREEIETGRFRKDLFYRISVATYQLPPLRSRRDDIEIIAEYWLQRLAQQAGRDGWSLTRTAAAALREHDWPGNVRELRNVLEHALCLATGPRVDCEDIAAAMSQSIGGAGAVPAGPSGDTDVIAVLHQHQWHRTHAARRLGISRTTLWRRLRHIKLSEGIEPL